MARRRFGSVRRLPSGRYRASYHDETTSGRTVAPMTFTTSTDARTWLATVEADVARGEPRIVDLSAPDLAR